MSDDATPPSPAEPSRTAPSTTENEQLLDWGLREQLRNREPVDLAASVHAALAAQATSPLHPPARRNSWLLAAGLLLGTAVVLAVALWQTDPDHQAAQQAPLPKPVAVSSVAAALALPLDTRAVEATNVDDAVIAALTRLRHLELLIVRKPENESFGLGLKIAGPRQPKYITNACWQHFATFTKLRALRLSGTSLVARIQTGDGEDVVSALEHLPLLEELSLRALDCDDQVLARLPKLRNLRRLNLDFNHGFAEPGMQALLQCRQLVWLSLQGCQQIHGTSLAALHELPNLEVLDVRSIDHMNWRAGTSEPDDAEGKQLQDRARKIADSLSVGVNDSTLQGLAKAKRLRVLEMSNGYWTAAGLSELGKIRSLRELNMFGGQEHSHAFVEHLPEALTRLEVCEDFNNAFCRAVRAHLPDLRHLNIAACDQITDRGIADLTQMASLRILDMRQMRGLTAAVIDELVNATQLEELDLRHNDFVTRAHIERLKQALPNLKLLQHNL